LRPDLSYDSRLVAGVGRTTISLTSTSAGCSIARIEQLSVELKEVRAEVQSLGPADGGEAQSPAARDE
jgi:hypothetical protein